MKRSMKIGFCAMRLCVMVLGIFLILPNVSAENEVPDVQAFLPLFEKNLLGRKILDVSYSLHYETYNNDQTRVSKQDVRLMFEVETGKYREEVKQYDNPNDTDDYRFTVNMWDGKEAVEWERLVSKELGFRSLGQGIYEHSGEAAVRSQPRQERPAFVSFYYDDADYPFSKTVPDRNPKLESLSDDMITIETEWNTFKFAKKTGALERIDYHFWGEDGKRKGTVVRETVEFSNHVERSGIWMPLRIVVTNRVRQDGRVTDKAVFSVDSKTLRLLDAVEDSSMFNEALPSGCYVTDLIRKKEYRVTTADTLPNAVEALKKKLPKRITKRRSSNDTNRR